MATSSATSQAWRTSVLVGGIETSRRAAVEVELEEEVEFCVFSPFSAAAATSTTLASSAILVSSLATWAPPSCLRPVTLWISSSDTRIDRGERSGVVFLRPSASTTSTPSTRNSAAVEFAQYSLKAATTVLSTMPHFLRSVPVHSTRMSLVSRVMAESAPLMTGGIDATFLSASRTTGTTAEPLRRGTNLRSLRSFFE